MNYFLFILMLALRKKTLFNGSPTTSPSKYKEMLPNLRLSITDHCIQGPLCTNELTFSVH